MASEQNVETAAEAITPAQRRRLQQLFEHATQTAEQAVAKAVKSNFDYANDLFSRCVLDDPSNRIYIQALLNNLYKKYNNNKQLGKLVRFKGSSHRSAIKKALAKGDLRGVYQAGLALLKLHPWDASALIPMAEICEKLKFHEAHLAWLKGAWIGNLKDPDVNRTCAKALARRGRFDEAIECWRRVKEALPDDDESDQAIAKLAVDKTIHVGKYDEAESTTDVMADKQSQAERRGESDRLTPEQQFQKLIGEKPGDLSNYLELAEILNREDRFKEVEQVLTQALSVSGGDLRVRELLEDAQIRRARQDIRVAERLAVEQSSEEAQQLVARKRDEVNRFELQVYASRCDRYPTNTGFRYELGVRLRRAGNYGEAIKSLQLARTDPKRKGQAHVELGECFRLIKQYQLAVNAYESALELLGAREDDARKLALYWAGKVSLLGIKDLEKAEKHLNELAGLDFNYRDLPTLLDKLAQLRKDS